MRLAYADPPYPGQAKRLYGNHPDYAGEVDHAELISKLREYDGWALSTSSTALREVLPLCPPLNGSCRLCIWHRAPRNYDALDIGWCFEPLIVSPARKKLGQYVPDIARIPQLIGPDITGQKPHHFSMWLFRLMGAQPDDTFDDLFPGSGAVGRAWDQFSTQLTIIAPAVLRESETSE